MNIFFLLCIAVAPGIAIAIFIYFKDKHEPEPLYLLIFSFGYGVLSLFVAMAISFPLNELVVIRDTDLTDQAIHAFGLVAFVEEFSKFIFIRWILFRDKNFDEPFDGIVYSVMVSMGFATIENVFYVINHGGETGILRMFTAVPAHGMFAVLMGYYLGKAKFVPKKTVFYSVIALLVATLFHGVYDYFLFISFIPGMWMLAFFSLVGAYILSMYTIRIHQDASPFKKTLLHPIK